ncbi:2'-5' RNA ligase family protein [Streptomyces sp. NPDC001262]|uniref:2'-5' RNA ligase family protein n=1 Tax=Streptomyces sp. NPDC001262 TaxID=3364552 RepID=UPI0036A5E419
MQLVADPGVFPPTPPSNLDDASAIVAHEWAAFGQVEEMKNHWDRPGWTAGTRAYYWMLTFPDAPALINHARHCQSALRHLDLDDIKEDGLHLTLGRIGRVGEIALEQLDVLAAAVSIRAPEAFTLHAIPLTASRGAVRYSVAPWTPILRLHAVLAAVGTSLGLSLRQPTSVLRPHLGISYCNRRLSARTVRDAVRPLRDLAAAEVPVHQVRLVELRREGHSYQWKTIHALALRWTEASVG